jgi:hypothetical protein
MSSIGAALQSKTEKHFLHWACGAFHPSNLKTPQSGAKTDSGSLNKLCTIDLICPLTPNHEIQQQYPSFLFGLFGLHLISHLYACVGQTTQHRLDVGRRLGLQ